MSEFIKLYEKNTDIKLIRQVVNTLVRGEIVVVPTDSVYSMACDINNERALEKMARLHGTKLKDVNFSIICHDLSQLSDYCKPIKNSTFKILKRNLPGPFTFILDANNKIPKIFKKNKKTVGIRIPDNKTTQLIVKELGRAIIVTSVKDYDEIIEYTTDPELIFERYNNRVEIIIDGGMGNNEPSTVVDCTSEPEIIRQGVADLIL